MIVTKELTRDKILAYLNHAITLAELVDWAENALFEAELEPQDAKLLRDIVARLGLGDVREFGLTWDDCSDMLAQLGYQVEVKATPIAA